MAGQNVNGAKQLAAGTTNSVNIQPSAGTDWIIRNIYYDQPITLNLIDTSVNPNVTVTSFDADTAANSMQNREFRLNNTHYLQVVNGSATNACNVAWDGVQTNP